MPADPETGQWTSAFLSLLLSPEPHFTPVYTQNAVTPLMVLIVKCLGFLHILLPDTILVHNSEVLSWCQSGITCTKL